MPEKTPPLLKFLIYGMVLNGTYPLKFFHSKILRKIYRVTKYLPQGLHILVCILMALEFFVILKQKNTKLLVINAWITIVNCLSLIKTFICRSNTFKLLIEHMIEEENQILRNNDEEIRKIHQNFIKHTRKFLIYVTSPNHFAVLFLMFGTMLIGFNLDPKLENKPLSLSIYLPFNQQIYYRTALGIQTMFLYITGSFYSTLLSVYLSILLYVKMQLTLLKHQFKFFDRYKNLISPKIDDMEMIKRLIKSHQSIIAFVVNLNEPVKYILLVETLSNSISLAVVVYQMLTAISIADWISAINYLAFLMVQLLSLAWYANEVRIESVALSDAIYECSWHEKSPQVQLMVKMVMLRAQKPLALTIGPFKPFTVDTVNSVLNAAYSYTTIMTNSNN